MGTSRKLGENSKGYSRSQTKEDIEITRKIRKAVVKDESLSINAQNVKIIVSELVLKEFEKMPKNEEPRSC